MSRPAAKTYQSTSDASFAEVVCWRSSKSWTGGLSLERSSSSVSDSDPERGLSASTDRVVRSQSPNTASEIAFPSITLSSKMIRDCCTASDRGDNYRHLFPNRPPKMRPRHRNRPLMAVLVVVGLALSARCAEGEVVLTLHGGAENRTWEDRCVDWTELELRIRW